MTDVLAALPIATETYWVAWAVFLRIAGLVALLPAFGEQSIPVRVRFALASAFTLLTFPLVSFEVSPAPNLLAVLTEPLVGLIFGLWLRLMVHAMQIAGTIAAQSTSLSQIFGGSAGIDPMPAMGNVLVLSALTLAVISGLGPSSIEYVLLSYTIVPYGTVPSASVLVELGASRIADAFALGFALAAPFLIASMLYNVTLGVINRAMPQLMVTFVGAPAITAGGLSMLALSFPYLLSVWLTRLAGVLDGSALLSP
ncbi:flagellar biosynthetic protein FliR [Pelagovum pacificum]|uniref:Flagellar biosynthetic protein FliR n=1 Tax=Pelagovum pacificum TaxID=2588711 RepID=A0A5C5GJ41_9RHOB|nr:flagellar biosynthetic protein FliR [Pelagovum pacificum]QQA42974.1 flagellar biosynthetic protein FliR [Pelagovum pacificum]TNY33881.1 flagellar biosynthetic protein FliR [Pelagovum pacificum]